MRSPPPLPILRSALDKARAAIIADLGSTADLPRELLNTVANIYYQAFFPIECRPPTGHNMPAVLQSFIIENARLAAGVEHMPRIIQSLRKIDRHAKRGLYDYSVEFLLDVFKYQIADAGNKTGVRRMIERKLKKVSEIDNLVDMMNLQACEETVQQDREN